MGIRQEQCNKVCRIIDDYLANRPRERDELIVAVRTVFKEAERKTENCSEKPNNCETQTDELREAKILLKASRDLLNKQNETIYVLNLLEENVEYHGAECDGYCLIDDIDDWFLQTEPQTERSSE